MKKLSVCIFGLFLPLCAVAMRDATPPVYGRPTLYGEYEINAEDTARAANMYGNAPRRASIRTIPNAKKAAVAKHPVKAKKAKPKKQPVKKTLIKPTNDSDAVGRDAPDVAKKTDDVVAPVETVVVSAPKPVVPSDDAVSIASVARETRDVSSYCVRRAKRGRSVPDGFVLMQGRPDLMSCVADE